MKNWNERSILISTVEANNSNFRFVPLLVALKIQSNEFVSAETTYKMSMSSNECEACSQ